MLEDKLLPVGLGYSHVHHRHICQWDNILLSNMILLTLSPPLLEIHHLV